jgi:hypothetical protein
VCCATTSKGTAHCADDDRGHAKSSGLLPEAEEAARIDQRIARYLADLDATDATENDDADAERTSELARVFPPPAHDPQRPDCVPGHVRFELRNVVANYPFESSRGFPGSSRIAAMETTRV